MKSVFSYFNFIQLRMFLVVPGWLIAFLASTVMVICGKETHDQHSNPVWPNEKRN